MAWAKTNSAGSVSSMEHTTTLCIDRADARGSCMSLVSRDGNYRVLGESAFLLLGAMAQRNWAPWQSAAPSLQGGMLLPVLSEATA
jgi:hypothetical protein